MDWEKFSEGFGEFLETNRVWIIAIAAVVLVVGAIILIKGRTKQDAQSSWTMRELSVGAMCLALAFLLSFIKLWPMLQGGSVTLVSMLPIMFFAYIYGTPKGLIVGLAYGFLQCLQDFYVVHWAQFLLDYILAFTVLGLAGLFRKSIFPGMILACVLRYIIHVVSGMIFFYTYAAPGQSVLAYSSIYNLYVLVDLVICIVVVVLPPVRDTIERLKREAQRNKQKAA